MSHHSSNPSASGTAEAGPESARYAVVCRCGWTSRGVREETALEIECDGCGARQFVLPVDVYPTADAGLTPAKPKRTKPTVDKAESKSRLGRRGGIKPSSRLKPTPEPNLEPATTSSKIKVPAKRRGRRIFSPMVLLIAGGVVILTATAFWTLHRRAILAAEQEFKMHADAGIALIRERKFGQAVAELRLAVAALDKLDRDDARARQVRQMLRESQAINELSESSLIDMLTEFQADFAAGDEWRPIFNSRFANRWIVLVTTVQREAGDNGRVVLDFPLSIDGTPVRLTGDPEIFANMTITETPMQIIIAAQLHSCHRVSDPVVEWQVKLDAESAFLWTDYENFRAMGFGVADEGEADTEAAIRALLGKQATIMEVAE